MIKRHKNTLRKLQNSLINFSPFFIFIEIGCVWSARFSRLQNNQKKEKQKRKKRMPFVYVYTCLICLASHVSIFCAFSASSVYIINECVSDWYYRGAYTHTQTHTIWRILPNLKKTFECTTFSYGKCMLLQKWNL